MVTCIGFDTVVRTPCGLAKPIFKDTLRYSLFYYSGVSDDTREELSDEEFDVLFSEKRVSRLKKPLVAAEPYWKQTVLFVHKSFLQEIGEREPAQDFSAFEPDAFHDDFKAYCLARDEAQALSDSWAEKYISCALANLRNAHAGKPEIPALKTIAEDQITAAIWAAASQPVLARAYLYRGVVVADSDHPDRLAAIRTIIEKRFPWWTWDNYLGQVSGTIRGIRLVEADVPVGSFSSAVLQESFLDRFAALARRVDAADPSLRESKAFEACNLFSNLAPSDEILEGLCKKLKLERSKFSIYITETELKQLARYPIAFMPMIIRLPEVGETTQITLNTILLDVAFTRTPQFTIEPIKECLSKIPKKYAIKM